MAEALGRLDELPEKYVEALSSEGLVPLWPSLRNLLPIGAPQPITQGCLWRFTNIRSLLIQAGELTPVEKAERRVLVLSDPGRGVGAMQATATIYAGLQLLQPGEIAPAHRHTPSAARIIVEGKGGFTVVDGEKLPMESGDLVLTPTGEWHDHGHEGDEPVIWLDALDLPLFVYLEGSYAEESPLQSRKNRPDTSQVEYMSAGIVPSRRLDRLVPRFPQMRYPWSRTESVLRNMSKLDDAGYASVDYVNPETGEDVLPALGFSAIMLKGGASVRLPKSSESALYHVIKGQGHSRVNGQRIDWSDKDTFSVPVFSSVEHVSVSAEAFLVKVHDRPLQKKLGYYEEQNV